MLKAPKFWYKKNDTYLSNSLYPLSLLFRFGTKIRNFVSRKTSSGIPVICIGNIVVGGAGKTPVALKIGNLLKLNGYNPHFVSRGYGGVETSNVLVKEWHSAKSVGDESLLLAEVAPTWIGQDRNKSFILAKEKGADCIIMDDGFQNPTLQKDFSIIVINGEQGFGNKRVIPSGPLRESISRGISRANLVIVIGEISEDVKDKIPSTVPIIQAKFQISTDNKIYKNQTKKIDLTLLDLNEIYIKKDSLNEQDIKNHIENNKDNFLLKLVDISYAKITPEILTDQNTFNEQFFSIIDEIENQINPSFTRTIIEDEKGQAQTYLLEELNDLMQTNPKLLESIQEQANKDAMNIEDVQKSYEHFFSPESDAGKIAVVHN